MEKLHVHRCGGGKVDRMPPPCASRSPSREKTAPSEIWLISTGSFGWHHQLTIQGSERRVWRICCDLIWGFCGRRLYRGASEESRVTSLVWCQAAQGRGCTLPASMGRWQNVISSTYSKRCHCCELRSGQQNVSSQRY